MKQLLKLGAGDRFIYGGVEWVKLQQIGGGALAVAANKLFTSAFDNENRADWGVSTLWKKLNGEFIDKMAERGADPEAFLDIRSDLTADDGMSNYGESIEKVSLLSDADYRKFREIIPTDGGWFWTKTPLTCKQGGGYVRYVDSEGMLASAGAVAPGGGVRPMCFLVSEIEVLTAEENAAGVQQEKREIVIQEAAEAVMETLGEYGTAYWGDVLAAVISGVFAAKIDAAEIERETRDAQAINNAPGGTDKDGWPECW